ncbi:MAG: hypothetical protein HWE39_10110 [Oceanospirillaceae bacterium]|nr:hypothetical protein [Oceanospirillaceae bacterium]
MSKPLTPELANIYALKAMMCSRTYIRDPERTEFPIEHLGWRKVDLKGNSVPKDENSYAPHSMAGKVLSNLQFDIWEKEGAQDTIFAFKGTDEKIDWLVSNAALGISIPYKSAKKKVHNYRKRFPSRHVSITGHSLGGGLALSVSVWLGLDSLVFNSSPRIFDGWRNANEPAERIAVFQRGDVLSILRNRWPKFLEKVPRENIVQSSFDYNGENSHRMDLMAEGIVRQANSPVYVSMAQSIPTKVLT